MSEPNKCPKCNGSIGYYYPVKVVGEQHMTWDGEGVHFEEISTKIPKHVTCCDCGKRVVRPVHGVNDAKAKEGK